MSRKLSAVILVAIIVALFGVFLLWPIWRVVQVGLFGFAGPGTGAGMQQQFTLAYVSHVFTDPVLRQGLVNSFIIAVGVTFLTLCIAVPLAVLSVKCEFPGKALLTGLLLVPLVLPPFVGAIGMRQILGRMGALTGVAQDLSLLPADTPFDWMGLARIIGIMVVEALGLYPIVFLNVSAALANLDPAMEQAAANLGASRWTIFRRITLPLMRPGLFAGGTIVLIWSFTELGTPLMFDFNRVTSVQIFQRISQVAGSPLPYAMVIVMLLCSTALYLLGKTLLGRTNVSGVTKASVRATTRKLTGARGMLATGAFAFVIGLALLPHFGVILTSLSVTGGWYESAIPRAFTLQHYATGLSHDLTIPAIKNSITFASIATLADILLGLVIAWVIVRSTLPARWLLDVLAMLPLAVPGLVLAFGYFAISLQFQVLFKNYPAFADFLNVEKNPAPLLIVAYAVRRLPYVVRSAVAGLQQTPVDLELAARNLGASHLRTTRRITLPLIGANLLAGGLLAFAFAMLEVSDSLILAQKQAAWPITKAIYELFQRLGDGPYVASALGVWAMVLLTLTILLANNLLGKKMGAIFRV
jgi:iron(III) transport system permease protein